MASRGKFVPPTVKRKKQNANYCYYCFRPIFDHADKSKKLAANAKTIDHFVPLTKGGNNFQYNMVICCHQCNTLKADFLPNEFTTVVSQLWQRTDYFKYSKQELRNIIKQVKHIRNNYDQNMRANKLYYLKELPVKLGMLQQLRQKYIKNGFSFSNNQHQQAAEC